MLAVAQLLAGSAVPESSKVMTSLKVIPWSSRLGFGRETDNSLRKNIDGEKSSEMLQKGLINRRRSGYKVKDLTFGIWSVRTPFKTGALICLLSQLKTKNKMGGRLPEGHVTNPRNTWMEETSRRQRRMEASYKGDLGPEGAVAP
jgi:hypothetical protein